MTSRWVQPGERGADFSYTKPHPAILVEFGYTFVFGYFTTPPSNPKKILEAAVDPPPVFKHGDYLDAGLVVGYVFEKAADRALAGAAAGVEDGLAFAAFLESIEYPPECSALAADDTATTGANIRIKQQYMDGFRSAMPNRGIYAGSKLGRVLDWDLGWLPNAWSWSVGVNTSTAVSRADAREAAIALGYHVIQSTGFYLDGLYPIDPNECVKPFLGWVKTPEKPVEPDHTIIPTPLEEDAVKLVSNSETRQGAAPGSEVWIATTHKRVLGGEEYTKLYSDLTAIPLSNATLDSIPDAIVGSVPKLKLDAALGAGGVIQGSVTAS